MPALLEIGIVVGLLIAPGLATVYIAREVSLSPDQTVVDSNSTILAALVIAVSLAAFELVVLSYLSVGEERLQIWGGLRLSELVSDERWNIVQDRPARIAAIASTEYLLHILTLAAIGWYNPFGRLLRMVQRRAGRTPDDPVVEAVIAARSALAAAEVFAYLRMKTGAGYSGTLQSVSSRPHQDGSRDVYLQTVFEGVRAIGPDVIRTGLLVNTRDVEAIELVYA